MPIFLAKLDMAAIESEQSDDNFLELEQLVTPVEKFLELEQLITPVEEFSRARTSYHNLVVIFSS